MSSLVLFGDTSGSVSLTVPSVAGSNTVTIASQTGTLNAAGPAFNAYQSSSQSVPNANFTKIQFQTETFDTNSNFDSSTNYRFTPTVAGYYQINGNIQYQGAIAGILTLAVYKNNAEYQRGPLLNTNASYGASVSTIVYCNGSTDYVELFSYQGSGGSATTNNVASTTYFNGCLLRGA